MVKRHATISMHISFHFTSTITTKKNQAGRTAWTILPNAESQAWFTRQVLCSTIPRRKALRQKGQRNHNGSKQNAKEKHQFGVQAVAIAK